VVASLRQRLIRHQLIGLDTSIFIYHLEANPQYLPLTQQILESIETGRCSGVVSTVTLMELTVHPWRINRADIARQYEVLLANFPNLRLIDVTREIARQAAQLRASYNVRPADALQVASAMISQATLWVSNDKKLKRLGAEIEIVILEDYLAM
jgi:predicted nucleic acid-binding protein